MHVKFVINLVAIRDGIWRSLVQTDLQLVLKVCVIDVNRGDILPVTMHCHWPL